MIYKTHRKDEIDTRAGVLLIVLIYATTLIIFQTSLSGLVAAAVILFFMFGDVATVVWILYLYKKYKNNKKGKANGA